MNATHLITGIEAEESVVEYLRRQYESFQLIARNVRYKHGEIDIIFEHALTSGARELVFLEVKASKENLDLALWNFSHSKQQKFRRATETFLASYRGQANRIRLGLALVSGQEVRILDWVI